MRTYQGRVAFALCVQIYTIPACPPACVSTCLLHRAVRLFWALITPRTHQFIPMMYCRMYLSVCWASIPLPSPPSDRHGAVALAGNDVLQPQAKHVGAELKESSTAVWNIHTLGVRFCLFRFHRGSVR